MKSSSYLNHDHKQVHKYTPEKEVGIGSRVVEIYLVLNILEIPPFDIRLKTKVRDLVGDQTIHSAIR